MKLDDFYYWINLEETKEVLTIINKEIQHYTDAVINGTYANEESMEKVAGKYIYTTAYLAGLKFIVNDLINHVESEDEQSE